MTYSAGLDCFIISPIGNPDVTADRYRKGKLVRDRLILPAIAVVNQRRRGFQPEITAYRGDEIKRSGTIMQHILNSIMKDAIVVGVLFEDNPNVWYELGIAHLLGRPVLLVKASDYMPPYDIYHLRHQVEFDMASLDNDAVAHLAVERLAAAIEDLFQHGQIARFQSPFDKESLVPIGRVFPHDRFNANALTYPAWSKMLLDAEDEIWLAGTSLYGYMFDPNHSMFRIPDDTSDPSGTITDFEQGVPANIAQLLKAQYFRGRHIHILTMDEKSPLLPSVLRSPAGSKADHGELVRRVRNDIRSTHRVLDKVMTSLRIDRPDDRAERLGSFRVTKVRNRTMTHRVTLTDRDGFVTPYFYSLSGINSGPCFQIAPKSAREIGFDGQGHSAISLYAQVLEDLRLYEAENGWVGIDNGMPVSAPALPYPADAHRSAHGSD